MIGEVYTRRAVIKAALGVALGLSGSAPAAAATSRLLAAERNHMSTRPIPRTGEALPVVGVGTWQTFDVGPNAPERTELKEVLRLLAGHGGSVIDSSPMYGAAERAVGDLAGELDLRDRLFFATKVWTSGRDAGIRQMEQSFRLMRTQRMDLMQVHNLLDVEAHTATLLDWKSAGRLRYVGITHYHSGAYAQVERLVKTKRYDFVQINFSMAEREAENRLLPVCAETATAVIINRPFSGADLFNEVKGRKLPPWAAEFDCTSWGQFFLKWILGQPAVTCVIPGTRRVAHLEDNVQAGKGRLPDAAMRRRMLDYLQQ
jgi:aryl-alcohol dehydrogenase-like predicted oxidoreductase